MKNRYVKTFESYINEALSEDQLNRILDKISSKGIDSLSERDKAELDNYYNPDYDFKGELCNTISELVEKYGSFITVQDLQSGSSPLYKQIDQEIHLIENLMVNGVEVVVYGGYKYQDEINDYEVPYSKLENHTLLEIKESLIIAIESGLLEEDL